MKIQRYPYAQMMVQLLLWALNANVLQIAVVIIATLVLLPANAVVGLIAQRKVKEIA
jgi:hypothetical protein